MERIFVGQFVSKEESMLDERISQAGNNYQLKFLRILKPKFSISIIPYFFEEHRISNNSISNTSFIYTTKRNRLIKYLYTSFTAFRIISKHKGASVWFYNLATPFSLLFFLIRYFTSIKIYIIVADFMDTQSILQKVSNYLISKSSGCIVLNRNMIDKIKTRTEILPGIIETEQVIIKTDSVNNNILFSGSLGKTNGFELVLEFAKQNQQYNVYITGKKYGYSEKEFQDLVNRYSQNNIFFLGLLEYEEYLDVLANCTFGFSLRDINDKQHDLNFPSKILEYSSKGLIVISSKSYPDLDNSFYFDSGYDVDGICKTLNEILNINIQDFRNRLFEYILSNFTESRLLDTIEKLENPNH